MVSKTMTKTKLLTAIALLCLACGAVFIWFKLSDPKVIMLVPEKGARWIKHSYPVNLGATQIGEIVVGFRKSFTVAQKPERALLTIRAFKAANVYLDGARVLMTSDNLDNWKRSYSVDLAPNLTPGQHQLQVSCMNQSGPPCLLAYCPGLDIVTDSAWESSVDGNDWAEVDDVEESRAPAFSRMFPSAFGEFVHMSPFFAVVFAMGAGVAFWSFRKARPNANESKPVSPAAMARWFLIGAWCLLALNNIAKVPLDVGFDISGHMEYIQHIIEKHRLPLATDGWTTFQPPLYYMIAAAVGVIVQKLISLSAIGYAARLISLLCGVAQVEVCYRTMRRLWPDREDLQMVGTFVGGLLPINLYMSQYAGNEPFAALTVSLAFYVALRFATAPHDGLRVRAAIALGLTLGAAMISKTTSLFMAAVAMAFFALAAFESADDQKQGVARAAKGLAIIGALIAIVAAWFYIRNWIELGKPFFGGWEPERGFAWWQDPGYRTPGQFLRFGDAFTRPIFSAVNSFWDGVYASLWSDAYCGGMTDPKSMPPWNYGLLLSGPWTGLIPTSAMVLGVISLARGPFAPARRGVLFATACVAVYLCAMLYGFLTVPYYCIVKASYTLGLLPCYGVLAAAGVDMLPKQVFVRAAAFGGLAAWAVGAYFAYFAR
jgi:hypothetical protein